MPTKPQPGREWIAFPFAVLLCVWIAFIVSAAIGGVLTAAASHATPPPKAEHRETPPPPAVLHEPERKTEEPTPEAAEPAEQEVPIDPETPESIRALTLDVPQLEGEELREEFADALMSNMAGEDVDSEAALIEELLSQPYALALFRQYQLADVALDRALGGHPYHHALHPAAPLESWCRCETHGGVPTWEHPATKLILDWVGERQERFRSLIPPELQAY